MASADFCPNLDDPEPVARPDARPSLSPSALCSGVVGKRDIGLLVLTMLRQFFANPENYRTPDLKAVYYSPDPKQTKVLIDKTSKFNLIAAGSVPAIRVKNGACRQMSLGIGAGRDVTDERGFENHAVWWVGGLTIFCTTKNDDWAELLQEEVAHHFTEFAPEMLRYGLKKFGVVESGEIGVVKGAPDTYAAPVSIGYAFHHGWSLRELSLPIRAIEFTPAFQPGVDSD
jgi:hypothetical protein